MLLARVQELNWKVMKKKFYQHTDGIIRKIKASFKRKQTLDRKRKDPLLNPKGPKGEILRCKACDSFRHMINECPHSWENLEQNKSLVVNESDEESFFGKKVESRTSNENIEDIILYTQKKENVSALCEETLGCMILDSGCSRNVCGESWWKSYFTTLSREEQSKVKVTDSRKKFRFGGDEVLEAIKCVTFPGSLADNKVLFSCHVVKSTIPFLWSKRSMAKAGVVLNLPEDSALIMGKKVDLDLTSAGHYSLQILPKSNENILLSLPEDTVELKAKQNPQTVWTSKGRHNAEAVEKRKMGQ